MYAVARKPQRAARLGDRWGDVDSRPAHPIVSRGTGRCVGQLAVRYQSTRGVGVGVCGRRKPCGRLADEIQCEWEHNVTADTPRGAVNAREDRDAWMKPSGSGNSPVDGIHGAM
ncbi:hypothetical protein Ct61P_12104 [Colletotrichum tofieldiae]|nr:hypothetical protein Ct61P_12104 [Colletotrichum tofieldiae]